LKISEMHGRDRPVFSFEFFPPKTDAAADAVLRTVADLREKDQPDFVSVTYGAGGSTRGRTLELVTRIQNELGITAMAHLTCVGHTREELGDVVGKLVDRGVENILALRGDPPKGEEQFVAHEGGFGHADELIGHLAEAGFPVDLGAACYPERHPESADLDTCIAHVKSKVDRGATFLVTHLFFDNADYFRFVEAARAAGIGVPIVPGIMPVTNVAQIERFTKMCGASIPEHLKERLDAVRDDPALVMATGIEHAIDQSLGLLEGGAPGLHFYTLNKSAATRSILAAVRAAHR
jgi:methylenetetrahydrofolate reductase (NADPH)